MGLAQFQTVLARLYTDSEFRDSIFGDTNSLQQIAGLTDQERAQLKELINRDTRLNQFARSLISKRRGEVAKILPITFQALGDNFRSQFAMYASTHSPSEGPKKHLQDALGFAKLVSQDQKLKDKDAVRFEADCLEARLRPILFRVRRYRCSDHLKRINSANGDSFITVWWRNRSNEAQFTTISF